ncbi:MAG TPA: SDR family NAD(P)-dependent oxidoreductase [Polyangiaceae bacterium]|jgi:NAD(P)-dependent dehydrogenase (short-subunit alcohol dehydrogenase family)|nr:SDR family NAD(P)-dependent oxidoreductase [Polyangiaceae bacterium]
MSKVWLVTGSSRGLGLEIAKAVLAAGDRLVATARNPRDLQSLVDRYGSAVRAVALDVTQPAQARAAVEAARTAFGRLDVVVNNAGYANVNSIEDVAEDDFRAQIETNFFGVVNVTRAALPVLRAQRSGHIIQVSSIGGRSATQGIAAYQSAKWAVGGFSEVLAREVAPLGIRVTVLEPGGMRTDWSGSSMRIDTIQPDYQATVGAVAARLRGNPHAAQGDPAKVAGVVIAIADEPAPPLRLLLGSDAVFMAGLLAKARAEEDAAWRTVSVSTDTDGVVPFAETPVAQFLSSQQPAATGPRPRSR